MTRKPDKNSYLPWVVAAAALAVAAFVALSAAAGDISKPESLESRFGALMEEFHADNSEWNITSRFPDSEIVFREDRPDPVRGELEFRYYYSEEANKTVIACDRNATVAVCDGRLSEPLSLNHLNTCSIIHPTVVIAMMNSTS